MKTKRSGRFIFFLCAVLMLLCMPSARCVLRASAETADASGAGDKDKEKDKEKDKDKDKDEDKDKDKAKDKSKAESRKKTKNGWVTKNSKTYYYKKGEKQTGWCRIKKKYYYFDARGVLQKNKIVGDKKTGYYYVDADGIRVTDDVIRRAVTFVLDHSQTNQSPEQRLRSCYNALCRYSYQRFYSHNPRVQDIRSYALYMFANKRGNCYRYGAALAYAARVLGFDSRVSAGGVTAYSYTSLSPHGWCEVKIGGVWKICDCSMQRAHTRNNLFLVEMRNYPFRIRRDKIFTMQVKNGGVSWI